MSCLIDLQNRGYVLIREFVGQIFYLRLTDGLLVITA